MAALICVGWIVAVPLVAWLVLVVTDLALTAGREPGQSDPCTCSYRSPVIRYDANGIGRWCGMCGGRV